MGIRALHRLFFTHLAHLKGSGPCAFSYRRLVVGNSVIGIKPIAVADLADIVGSEVSTVNRLAAGELLAMMDLCAKRVVDVFLSPCLGTEENISMCTVGVTNTTFWSPVLQGDVVRMNGRVVYCGSTSLGVYIRFFRHSATSSDETIAGESYFTMVTIDGQLRAVKVVPAVELTEKEDICHYERYMTARAHAKEGDKTNPALRQECITVEDVQCPVNLAKHLHVPIASTRTTAQRIFLNYHMNNNRTIFGGELMRWMERHAVHCARMFTKNRHVFTLRMHSVEFRQPVLGTDWVSLDAEVVYVHNTTMEVDVRVEVERTGRVVLTNRASFTIINTNEIAQKTSVTKGIDLGVATQEELLRFAEAKRRYHSRLLGRT
ncbi:hypothetical protein TRVL_08818 [Trypanosoma vivax]|nr:hypothetical protein TRVL_08818 [Trypanosoma vivax]